MDRVYYSAYPAGAWLGVGGTFAEPKHSLAGVADSVSNYAVRHYIIFRIIHRGTREGRTFTSCAICMHAAISADLDSDLKHRWPHLI